MIRIEKIRKSFGDRTIIDDLSIEFGPHEVTAIVGSSGRASPPCCAASTSWSDPTAGA